MPRYGRSVPDDTRPPRSPPVYWEDVTTDDRGFFAAMTAGPRYVGPRGQACAFQPVASKKDPRPRRFSEQSAGDMREIDTTPKARSPLFGRATGVGRVAHKVTAEDRYAWAHEPLFLLPGFDQTPLDRGRHIDIEHLVLPGRN